MNLKNLCRTGNPPEWYGSVLARVTRGLLKDAVPGDFLEIGIGAGNTHTELHRAAVAASNGHPPTVLGIENLARPDIFHIDIDAIAARIYEVGSTPHILIVDSAEAIQYIRDRHLAFLFVDASHTYEDTYRDIETFGPLVVPKGVMAVHDVEQEAVMRAVTEHAHWFAESCTFPAPDPEPRMMWCGVKA